MATSTSIEPIQKIYNSRYLQNIQIDEILNKNGFPTASIERSKLYLSRLINQNLKALTPGVSGDRTILNGYDCYIYDFPSNSIKFLVTPGSLIFDSTLLMLYSPEINLEYTFPTVVDNTIIDKLAIVLKFNYDMIDPADQRTSIFHKRKLDNSPSSKKYKYQIEQTQSAKFTLSVRAISPAVYDSNGNLVTVPYFLDNPTDTSDMLVLAVFKPWFKDNQLFRIEQYSGTYKSDQFFQQMFRKYGISQTINIDLLNEKIINELDLAMLEVKVGNKTYPIYKFSNIPTDVKNKIINSFKKQFAARHMIPDLPFYTRRLERFSRVSQIIHEHNN